MVLLKYCSFVMIGVLMMLGSFTSSVEAVSTEQLSIGGISFGDTEEYVKSIYGKPNDLKKMKPGPIENGVVYTYGNSFKITFSNGRVFGVATSANNGLGTSDGVFVGMNEDAMYKVYGEPNSSKNGTFFYKEDGRNYRGLRFKVDDGVIEEISLYTQP